MKRMIFPFSIRSDIIEKDRGFNKTPTNGRIFSCRSHFHPTTSLMRGWRTDVNDLFDGGEVGWGTYFTDGVNASCPCDPESFYRNTASFEGRFINIRKAAHCKRRGLVLVEGRYECE